MIKCTFSIHRPESVSGLRELNRPLWDFLLASEKIARKMESRR